MITGIGVSNGVIIAPAIIWHTNISYDYIPRKSTRPSFEVDRFEAARRTLWYKINDIRSCTSSIMHSDESAIFEVYKMILDDEDGLLEPLRNLIWQKRFSAEYAVITQFNLLLSDFLSIEDDYIRQRSDDMSGLRDQLLRILLDRPLPALYDQDSSRILVSTSCSPVDITCLDWSYLAGIVCECGDYSSHMSIIARALSIPCIVGVSDISGIVKNNDLVALDGEKGELWINPTPDIVHMIQHRGNRKDKQESKRSRISVGLPFAQMGSS